MIYNECEISQQDVYQEIEGLQIDIPIKPLPKMQALAKEHKIQIYINEKPVYQVVCTADCLEALVVGRLLTEGVIRSKEEIASLYLCETGERAKVFLKNHIELENNAMLHVATCCTDNKTFQAVKQQNMRKLAPIAWSIEDISMLSEAMEQKMPLYEATHAVHSCFLAQNGHILYACEDIGRHNALDKVIGLAAMQEVPLEQCMIFTSGRVPTDMVSKVIRAGIPVLFSKGAPTAEAVEMAKDYDLTLVCHVRKQNAIKYNGNFGERNE